MLWVAAGVIAAGGELRVCSDPNNLPFSNRASQGFENRLAELIAGDLGASLHYTWWQERRNFIRNTLNAGRCDVVLGIPTASEGVLTTRPYYRSTYVLVYPKGLNIRSLDDPALAKLRIGIHVVDDNYAPPAYVLARRGIVRNIVGYSLYGARGESDPPAKIFDALERREIDVAIVWGPLGGYFGTRSKPPLEVVPIRGEFRLVPLAYDISVGVRKSRPDLKSAIQRVLDRDHARVEKILAAFGVPQLGGG